MYITRLGAIYKAFENFCMYSKKWRILSEFEDLLYMYLYVPYTILWGEKFVTTLLNTCKMNLINMLKEFLCLRTSLLEYWGTTVIRVGYMVKLWIPCKPNCQRWRQLYAGSRILSNKYKYVPVIMKYWAFLWNDELVEEGYYIVVIPLCSKKPQFDRVVWKRNREV